MVKRIATAVAVALLATSALLAIQPTPARAQAGEGFGFRGWGARIGYSTGPDQFVFGAHMDIGNLMDNHLRFEPSIDLGLGSDLTYASFGFGAAWRVLSEWEAWSPYLGAGAGFNVIGSSDSGLTKDSETDTGLIVFGGLERGFSGGDRFFLEGKFGVSLNPDFKVILGYTFP